MDILKVLSRGTKRTAKSAGHAGGASAKLPSSTGVAATNPQLYHDEVRGQKRKRSKTEKQPIEGSAAEELPEVDFFAPQPEQASAKPQTHDSKSKAGEQTSTPVLAPAKRISEEDCRQILRSHRLKVTLLSKQEEEPKKVKKSKKKKAAAAEEESKKDEKKKAQLYPQPLETFGQLRSTYGISRRISENLVAQSYRVPTEVQLGSLPLLLEPKQALGGCDAEGLESGVDFLAVAPTGSGKTISFLIPAIHQMMRRRGMDPNDPEATTTQHELEAVIVVPTRELAHQIVNEGLKLLQGTGIKIMAMKKQMNLDTEEQELAEDSESDKEDKEESNEDEDDDDDEDEEDNRPKRINKATAAKPDILVTTPQLLLNFLTSGPATTHRILPDVRDLILDEADVLLDALFYEQTMGVWSACTNTDLRVSFWSATMGSNIEAIMTDKLQSRAKGLGVRRKPFVRLVVGLKDTAVPNIVHKLTYTASEQGKLLALRQLLHPTTADDSVPLRPPFIVFTQTIDRAAALHEELKYDIPLEAGGSTRIAALHSGLPESARASIMRKFRAGEIWVLITTDVLARGVDFAGVNGVVNYDVPGSSAAYVHRAGRTGRAGREGGIAVTFYTKEDIPFVKTVANVIAASERQSGKLGEDGIQKWLLDALPKVNKADRKKLRERGVESRRSGAAQARITSTSGYERRRENNRRGAIEGSKRRKTTTTTTTTQRDDDGGGADGEWKGIDD
ncbi:DEAD/DEAH box helicase [Beauveria bassiana ARSEF 2860]|uniref:ATP-dependent RNA helicase n=1 Tax=Beauveria bassiana (strain ARSEF 2860) TaxID=655819 RepID=J5K964_BEAB2|nr:DEAD/DEAH box helicase [Beauveria bassiana ARSEF 2860]EJP70676.1 DEAD/DEAH box helicase [Beauveria bassiana ARSEF 2860]